MEYSTQGIKKNYKPYTSSTGGNLVTSGMVDKVTTVPKTVTTITPSSTVPSTTTTSSSPQTVQRSYTSTSEYRKRLEQERENREAAEALKAEYERDRAERQEEYREQVFEIEQEAVEEGQEAYINKRMTEQSVPEELAAVGLTGGLAEQLVLEAALNYEKAVQEITEKKAILLAGAQKALSEDLLDDSLSFFERLRKYLST